MDRARINSEKPRACPSPSPCGLAVLQYYPDAATDTDHKKAGHGKKENGLT
jgi:hypothetical protein